MAPVLSLSSSLLQPLPPKTPSQQPSPNPKNANRAVLFSVFMSS
ncbi:Uncharacterised protein [Yersinia mollaretii]|nr:Uncharacterised protein [Yersinia mollaretii]CQH04479.1 Uncharacterised protein [Yersinia mollaretii]